MWKNPSNAVIGDGLSVGPRGDLQQPVPVQDRACDPLQQANDVEHLLGDIVDAQGIHRAVVPVADVDHLHGLSEDARQVLVPLGDDVALVVAGQQHVWRRQVGYALRPGAASFPELKEVAGVGELVRAAHPVQRALAYGPVGQVLGQAVDDQGDSVVLGIDGDALGLKSLDQLDGEHGGDVDNGPPFAGGLGDARVVSRHHLFLQRADRLGVHVSPRRCPGVS
jgi:hypothetical protein